MSTPSSRPLAFALTALLCGACAVISKEDEAPKVGFLVTHGRYEEAVGVAAENAAAAPGDPTAQREHRMASAAYQMEVGRRAVFEKDFHRALEQFRSAKELAPDSPEVDVWLDNTVNHLADEWITKAFGAHMEDDLHGAQDAYYEALSYRPDDIYARQGLARLLVQLNHRQGAGEKYYDQGVGALADYFLHEARQKFYYTIKYVPGNARARQRIEETNRLLADQRVAIALELERTGNYAAASNEFRITLLLDDDNADALEGLERTKREVSASEKLTLAQMEIVRDNYDSAAELIVEGRTLTLEQGDSFEAAEADLEQARYGAHYEQARGLENDYRYVEAVAAYDELLAQAEFYDDAITRRKTLQDYIEKAADLLERARATEDDAERESLYKQLDIVWPGHRN